MSKWHTIAQILMGTGIISFTLGILIWNPALIVVGAISMVLSIFLPS